MSILTIDVAPELEQRLQEEAARSGQSMAEVALVALDRGLLPPAAGRGVPKDVSALLEELPRRSPSQLLELATTQGVKRVERFEDLLGDFWPEEESGVQFLEWLHAERRDRQGASSA
jgi:hypothetical protein